MSSSPSFTLDDTFWPLRFVRFVGVATPQQFEQYLAEMDACLRRGERFVCILDISRGGVPTPEQRQRQTSWLKENEQLLRQFELGVAFLVTSPLVRLALSTIFYFKPMPVPYLVTAQMPSALEWATLRFTEAGLHAHSERIRHHFGLPSREGLEL
ncbi:MAG TPA: STAS/SEC14 domain-containing protein [Archangium sp.]|nr:STAS/SEC14 domain-containing protein [Archangium sp.]